ncbi:helix-turn-helix domain-containing protein [Bradyrhizobium frederickii]|nr:helix-turn-helix domain-containing protein [Bradyrhizobium frederickii]
MRRVRDVIRMKAAGLPSREIARRVGAAPSTVRLAIRRFEAAGLTWPLPDELTDAALELCLFAKTGNGNRQGHRRIAEPDWTTVHRELKRKHGTHTMKLTITHIFESECRSRCDIDESRHPRHMIRFPGGGSLARAR